MNNESGRYLRNLLSLPPVYFFLLQKLLKQKRFVKTHVEKELFPFKINKDKSLDQQDIQKVLSYYSLGVPAVLGESFCVLRGKKMLPKERLCMTFLGGISGLLDDLFDDPKKKVNHLENFILQPEALVPANNHEKLLQNLYKFGLHYSPLPEQIKLRALKVFESQKESLEQQNILLQADKMEEITYSKGGSSFLYYRLCLEHPLYAAEETFLYELGGLMQMGNDIFDLWEDHQNGINTAATICIDVRELRQTFSERFNRCFSLAYKTGYPEKNIHKFLKICSLALARVYVCLDQFLKLQKTTGNHFSINSYTRKQLICDMQKPANQFKALKIFVSISVEKNFLINK